MPASGAYSERNARRYGAVIVAAGRGERAGGAVDGPKQYRLIGGRPVIAYSLDTLAADPRIVAIVAVIHRDDVELFAAALAGCAESPRVETVIGGATRQASVLAGLQALAGRGITHVLIHDAVRPFLSRDLLDRIDAAIADGRPAVLPAIPVADTLKRADAGGHVETTVSREGLYAAQTPQTFAFEPILAAHERAAGACGQSFTDDASIAEWAGIPVTIVEGAPDNMKLTVKRDIAMADERLRSPGFALPDVRTGNGYDVHQLVPGDHVTLCGVRIDHDQRLSGHSDADVGLHALTDALLATCGAGDIGDHFPPSDPQWRGAASHRFVEHAVGLVKAAGGQIMNADVTLIAEAPRIGPHRQAMREAMAAMLGIAVDRCSVKATTNETIGFVGRREGIAAIATASVAYRSLPEGKG